MNGDAAGRLGEWFDAHAARLVLYARQWVGDRSAAEDVVQECFLRLLGRPGRSEPCDVRAWLFAAVRNAAIAEQRSRSRRARREQVASERRGGWFEPSAGDTIDARAAERALAALPDELREIVVLRLWGELTLAEASAVLGEPPSTLFSRYQTALKALRREMETSPCKTPTMK
jgi:RNA polymerase sigma-70 factor (ECF subfamily)